MSKVGYKAELHKAKKKVALAQESITVRRYLLWKKLASKIKHPDDKKIVSMALTGKNLTPRYW